MVGSSPQVDARRGTLARAVWYEVSLLAAGDRRQRGMGRIHFAGMADRGNGSLANSRLIDLATYTAGVPWRDFFLAPDGK